MVPSSFNFFYVFGGGLQDSAAHKIISKVSAHTTCNGALGSLASALFVQSAHNRDSNHKLPWLDAPAFAAYRRGNVRPGPDSRQS